jgi:hypothetical protein
MDLSNHSKIDRDARMFNTVGNRYATVTGGASMPEMARLCSTASDMSAG